MNARQRAQLLFFALFRPRMATLALRRPRTVIGRPAPPMRRFGGRELALRGRVLRVFAWQGLMPLALRQIGVLDFPLLVLAFLRGILAGQGLVALAVRRPPLVLPAIAWIAVALVAHVRHLVAAGIGAILDDGGPGQVKQESCSTAKAFTNAQQPLLRSALRRRPPGSPQRCRVAGISTR
ncbi:hypothetical protein [Lysobacter sp. CA196]|uniref:hypothetical protein n=1 Tax=Lysobacter sp. CA196 TaxID=3455606 RepID=UPI003F8D3DC9